jgi:DegV family protein with EDD domain
VADFVLTCSSTVDMPESFFKERNIQFLCYHFHMDGKEYPDDLGKTMSFEEFYRRVDNGALPVTSQINMEQFMGFFEPLLQAGKDVLHIEMSSGLSGTFNSCRMAKEELDQKYPERKLKIVDSLGASSGFGLLVDTAADLRDQGMDIDAIHAWLEENKLNVHHWFTSTDLSHYRRGGRISAASAAFGTLLHICPVMNMDHKGTLVPRKKVRGKKNALKEIVEKMKEHAQNGVNYSGKCFISHSDCEDDARAAAELMQKEFPNLKEPIRINCIGTVIGSHTGRGTVAVYFFGGKRVD